MSTPSTSRSEASPPTKCGCISAGATKGPHHRDVDLRDILPIILRLNAKGLMVEAANPRHAHEWEVFESVALPDGKILIPGVIDASTNYIEHPHVVWRDRVIAGTDCGFSTFASFLPVEPRIAWAKLRSLTDGAELTSAQLW